MYTYKMNGSDRVQMSAFIQIVGNIEMQLKKETFIWISSIFSVVTTVKSLQGLRGSKRIDSRFIKRKSQKLFRPSGFSASAQAYIYMKQKFWNILLFPVCYGLRARLEKYSLTRHQMARIARVFAFQGKIARALVSMRAPSMIQCRVSQCHQTQNQT